MWIPKNKKTGQEYAPIADSEKAEWLNDPYIKTRYTFRQIAPDPIKKAIETATAAKKSGAVSATLKEPFEAKRVVNTTADPETGEAVEQ